MKMSVAERYPYFGQHVAVRKVCRRDGCIVFALCRPGNLATLDHFDDLDRAVAVAKYVEEHGGSYEAAQRKAAWAYADQVCHA